MAGNGMINDVFNIPAVEAQFKYVEERLAKFVDQAGKASAAIAAGGSAVKGASGVSEQAAAQEQLNRNLKAGAAATSELAKAEAQLLKIQSEEAVKIAAVKEQIKAQNEANRDAVRTRGLAKDSIKAMEVEVKKLTQAYYDLSKAEREGSKGTAMKEQIKSLNDGIRGLKTSLGDWKANVGNYRESLEAVNKGFIGLDGAAGNAATTVLGFAQGLMKGGMGAVMLGIGLATSAVVKIYEKYRDAVDSAAEANIRYMRTLAGLKSEQEKFNTEVTKFTDNRSETEKSYSEWAIKFIQQRQKAEEVWNTKRRNIMATVGDMDERQLLLNNAAIEYQKDLIKIQEQESSVYTKISQQKEEGGNKAVSALTKEKDAIDQVFLSYVKYMQLKEQGQLVGPRGDMTLGQLQGAPTLEGVTPKESTGISTGVQTNIPKSNLLLPIQGESPEEKTKREAAEWNKRVQLAAEAMSRIDNIVSMVYSNRFAQIEQESQADQIAKEKELKAAEGNSRQIRAINDRYDAKEKEREKEKRRVQLEQAKYQRRSALINAVIQTALGVTGALAQTATMGWAAWVLAAINLAAGIAETAIISSQPLPSYKKGRKGGPAELANVGEAGTEAVVTKTGQVYFTPPTTTQMFLPEGASVIPHERLLEHAGTAAGRLSDWPGNHTGYDGLRSEVNGLHAGFAMLAQVISDKPEHQWNVTERGLNHLVRRGAVTEEWINERVRL